MLRMLKNKSKKGERMKHNANIKEIMFYIILLCLFIGIGFVISGCAAFKDAKRYEMKASPCACDEKLFIRIDVDNLA